MEEGHLAAPGAPEHPQPEIDLDDIDREAIRVAEAKERLREEFGIEDERTFAELEDKYGQKVYLKARETPLKRRKYEKRKRRTVTPAEGMTVGRLTAVQIVDGPEPGQPKDYYKKISRFKDPAERLVECFCDCGTLVIVGYKNFVSGNTSSCGCLGHEVKTKPKTHGKWKLPEYRVWQGMKDCCNNRNSPRYAKFGALGITVCATWNDFAVFYGDMGPRPLGFALSRKDASKGFSAANCEWVPNSESKTRTRGSALVAIKGISMTRTAWIRRTGSRWTTVIRKMKRGITFQDAIDRRLSADPVQR